MFFTSTKWWFTNVILFSIVVSLPLLSFQADGQVVQPQRFEIELPDSEKHFDIITGAEAGLYLYRSLYTPKSEQIHLVKLDTGFQHQWSGYLPVEKNYIIVGKRAFKENLYLLLRYIDFTKNNFILIAIDSEGNYQTHNIKGYIPFSPTEFQITEQAVLIGGYFNRVPLVLHYSLEKLNSKVLPGMFNESGELTQVRTHDDGSFDVLISSINYHRTRTIWIKNYDPQGNLNSHYTIDTEDNRHLIFGRLIKTNNNIQIVAGVYGSRTANYSNGIFISKIEPSGLQQIRYYSFADLENFFKYMKAKREQRVKSRIERRKVKGKRIRLNYRFLVHELVPYKDQFILLGEAFFPKYIPVDRSYGGFFTMGRHPNSIIQDGRIFDGYYYTHAVVMGFTPEGDLLWDNSFEINDVRTFTLEQFVKLDAEEDKIALLYMFDNNIRTKIIQNNQVLEGKSADPIITSLPPALVKSNSSEVGKLEYWYNGYLYAYGVQENEKSRNYERKRVFYINKVKYLR
jgi:hypothetical protein